MDAHPGPFQYISLIMVRLMKSDVVDVLPAVHALSGCDTTSKVGTKTSALQATEETGHEQLESFGKLPLSDDMISASEKFLVDCLSSSDKVDTLMNCAFRHITKRSFNWTCTLKSTILLIGRAYLQCYQWTHVASMEGIDLNPIEYGYSVSEDDNLVPEILDGDIKPSDFPLPCNCLKCAKSTVCPCRIKHIMCCEFCKYGAARDGPYSSFRLKTRLWGQNYKNFNNFGVTTAMLFVTGR